MGGLGEGKRFCGFCGVLRRKFLGGFDFEWDSFFLIVKIFFIISLLNYIMPSLFTMDIL